MPDWAATSGGTAWEGGGRGTGSQEPSFRFPTARGSSGHSSRPPLDPPIKKEETRRDRLRSGSAAQRMSKSGAGTAPCLPHSAARPYGRLVERRRRRR
ncbi:unnamed protein product [Rangifer tarandus platyrhynchus]|uniref:Uncharacterized protein n=1 Tax=Rangifer tarandus platyrhynchus TaxID=3082113 RepID=A0ABN9A543_RANTA|nr:unnamed protein product [Rangifer tarandus platyrhynchus]